MPPVLTYKQGMRLEANSDEVPPGLVDGNPRGFVAGLGLREPREYEEISLASVKEMMLDMDRRAKRVGIISAVSALAVAAVLIALSRDSFLIVIATTAFGALVSFVTTRIVSRNAQHHQSAV